jgi:hypothetical protein
MHKNAARPADCRIVAGLLRSQRHPGLVITAHLPADMAVNLAASWAGCTEPELDDRCGCRPSVIGDPLRFRYVVGFVLEKIGSAEIAPGARSRRRRPPPAAPTCRPGRPALRPASSRPAAAGRCPGGGHAGSPARPRHTGRYQTGGPKRPQRRWRRGRPLRPDMPRPAATSIRSRRTQPGAGTWLGRGTMQALGPAVGRCKHQDLGSRHHFAIGLQFVPGCGAAGCPACDWADRAESFPTGRERCFAHVLLFVELRTCRWHGQRQHGISTATTR